MPAASPQHQLWWEQHKSYLELILPTYKVVCAASGHRGRDQRERVRLPGPELRAPEGSALPPKASLHVHNQGTSRGPHPAQHQKGGWRSRASLQGCPGQTWTLLFIPNITLAKPIARAGRDINVTLEHPAPAVQHRRHGLQGWSLPSVTAHPKDRGQQQEDNCEPQDVKPLTFCLTGTGNLDKVPRSLRAVNQKAEHPGWSPLPTLSQKNGQFCLLLGVHLLQSSQFCQIHHIVHCLASITWGIVSFQRRRVQMGLQLEAVVELFHRESRSTGYRHSSAKSQLSWRPYFLSSISSQSWFYHGPLGDILSIQSTDKPFRSGAPATHTRPSYLWEWEWGLMLRGAGDTSQTAGGSIEERRSLKASLGLLRGHPR